MWVLLTHIPRTRRLTRIPTLAILTATTIRLIVLILTPMDRMRIRMRAFMADIGAAGAIAIDRIIVATIPMDTATAAMVTVPEATLTAAEVTLTAAEVTLTVIVPATPMATVVRTLAEVDIASATGAPEASAVTAADLAAVTADTANVSCG